MPVEVYGSVTEATMYFAERGRDSSAWLALADDDARSIVLARASEYIDQRYRHRRTTGAWVSMFYGGKEGGRSQQREWPRVGAVDYEGLAVEGIPTEIEHATYEAALREAANPGSLSPDYVATADGVTSEKIGPHSFSYRQDDMKAGDPNTPNRPIIPVIDEIVAPLLQVVEDTNPGIWVI